MPINRRRFGTRGRPEAGRLAENELPSWGVTPVQELEVEDKKKAYLADFDLFLREVIQYPDYDTALHGALADFISSSGKSYRTKDKFYNSRIELGRRLKGGGKDVDPKKITKDDPYGVPLDGSFRGCVIVKRGKGKKKIVLVPRGHLKSSIVTEAYAVWRIIKNPLIRILIANATATNAFKFLRSIKWFFTNNKVIKELWPELALSKERILRENIIWAKNEFCVPKPDNTKFEAGESTVEGIGVLGNLVSRHYDLIIADDLVNNKNVKTAYLIDQVLEWYQLMHSLLEPDGEVICVGTRWDYQDLYSSLIYGEANQEFSLFLCTAVGKDGEPFYPGKYNRAVLAGLERDLGPYKFSCQYMNQPVDRENAEFQASWFQFFTRHSDAWKDYTHYSFLLCDPAFTEDEGDATAMVFVRVTADGHWWVCKETCALKVGNIPAIVDKIFEITEANPDLMQLGIETRGFQRAIAHGLYEEMARRQFYFAVKELKGESNRNKKTRILRLAPLMRLGMIHFEGASMGTLEGGVKILVNQLLRHPRGADDLADALAYGCDTVVKPEIDEVEDGNERVKGETHKERLKRLSSKTLKKIHSRVKNAKAKEPVDPYMGSEN